MNNFHFNPSTNRSVQLKKQLEQMNRDIQSSKKQLQKKNLQLQFYQDPDYVNNKPSGSQKHIKYPQNNNKYPENINKYSQNNNNIRNVPNNDFSQNNSSKNNYQNLADQIMNDLLQDNKSKPINYQENLNNPYQNQYQNQKQNQNQNLNINKNQPNEMYQNQNNQMYQNQNNQMYQNQNDFNPFAQNSQQFQNYNNNQSIPQINPQKQQPSFQPRQNNFIPQNKRQLEKQKLQNPSSFQQNPFVPKSQPIKRSIETKQQKPIVNQRQLQKLKLQQQSGLNQNPFWGQNNKNRSQEKSNQNKNVVNYQQYENIREKQKEKLQQQIEQNKDFGAYQRPTSPTQIPAQKDIQSQNVSKKAAFQNRYSNPFSKDQNYLKQMRQQQQKEYRRALEQQKKIQEERKRSEKQKLKQQKYAFNSYEPGSGGTAKVVAQQNDIPIKSPALGGTKKVDPNGRPPVYNYEQNNNKSGMTSAEREFMKMKANQLKQSFNKGRILYDEYISQIKKLAEYYKINYRELVEKKDLDGKEEDLPWIKDKKQYQPIKVQEDKKTLQEVTQRKDNYSQNYQIMENQMSLQKFPDSEVSLKNNQFSRQPSSPSRNPSVDPYSVNLSQQPYYGQQYQSNPIPGLYTQNLSGNPQQYGLASTSFLQQMQGVDYDLMRRMFQQMKAMRTDYTKSLQKQKSFLQQTFMKFLAHGVIQNQGQNQNQPQNQSQIKRPTDLSPKQVKKGQNIFTQNSQQNFNEQSMEFIEKSLSGIVNKIPFYSNSVNRSNNSNGEQSFMMGTPQQNINKKQVMNKDKNQESIEEFFSKPYKCKKFKKFSIMVDVSQSSMQIPSVSNFLALKNGKDILNKLFEEDLLMMKKLQREKEVDKLRNHVDNQLSYGIKQSPQQPLKIQQKNKINKQASYGQPPSNVNYGQTFNRNQDTGQFIVKASENIIVTPKNNSFQEYENYSRNKERETKSSHQQNHRSYKKVDQSVSETAFLKRHNSGQEQNLPDFADQSDIKSRSPVYYSPKLGSQILEQDEYQTAQKSTNQQLLESEFYGSSAVKKVVSPDSKQSTNKKYKMTKKDYAYEQERESQKKSKSKDKSLSFKQALKQRSLQKEKQSNLGIMKMITKNNQVLKKYQISPQNRNQYTPREQAVDIREYSSINSNPPKDDDLKNYFSGGNTKNNNGQNQSYKLPLLVANLNNVSGNQSNPSMEKKLSNKFNTQKQDLTIYDRQQSIQEIKSDDDDLPEDRSEYVSSQQYPTSRNQNMANYEASQQKTVKSINYSVASSRRPPQSVNISQTVESIQQSASRLMRPPLSKKKSTSRKKQSSIVRTKFQKDSILQKPPPSESQMNSMIQSDNDDDLVVGKEPLKFDSNVYDSEYEQSVSQKDLQKRISQLQNQQKMKISQPQISLSPPVIANNKSNVLNIQGLESKSSLMGGNKLKSLQQARNLAKESKKKSINLNENDQMFKYEEKMSELESFLTKRQESIIKQTKETKTIKLAIQKSPAQKKNIMNLLDELQNESSYRDDFESYRQQSERPRY